MESMHLFHPRTLVTDHVEILNNPDGIYLKEYKFFRQIFRTLTDNTKLCLNRKTFRRTPCIILEPYANWCKENKRLWLHEYLALLDIIVMRTLHGCDISEEDILTFAKQNEFRHTPNKVKSPSADAVASFVLLVSFLIDAGRFEQARDELVEMITHNESKQNNTSFNISHLVSEAGYGSIFHRTTLNAIHEQTNLPESVLVSVGILLNYLLSKCYRSLGEQQKIEMLLIEMTNIHYARHVNQQYHFESVLLWEVAELCGDKLLSSEMLKLSMLSKIKHFETKMDTVRYKSCDLHQVR